MTQGELLTDYNRDVDSIRAWSRNEYGRMTPAATCFITDRTARLCDDLFALQAIQFVSRKNGLLAAITNKCAPPTEEE